MSEKQVRSERGIDVLQKVRVICQRLPEVTEAVDKFGHTSFRVNDKPFVMMGEGKGELSLSIKTLLTTQEVLLQRGGFTKTNYIGHHGWVTLDSTDDVDWTELEELMIEGYLRSAPKRLVKQVMAP
ncbi:phosphoribosylglycinamide formyltransferase [Tumebacillus algifaecis]|uniref:Phosphoribosylglycinamide formyltransferase n=1 Tax=Tumebacillus algifaecis TaxID=1214604 RepID=A0A223D368_9BACL|nr:MmcQ/YjbR family DNA-binding protein [Tumebacillus algifaecis]ASS76010.1 phosphoribosylglycinamide formyltransferase [Tumebacillus algifaecis]